MAKFPFDTKVFLVIVLLGAFMVLTLLKLASADGTINPMTATWTAPTTNEDGSSLTDLAGYDLLIGTVKGGPYAIKTVTVADPVAVQYAMNTLILPDGQYYSVVKAFDAAGNRSLPSGEAPFVLNRVPPKSPAGLLMK